MLIRKHSQTTKQRSKKSEKKAAEAFGGRVQPASGAINRFHLKGDVKSKTFLVDDKVTDNSSYSLKLETWRKLSSEAWKNKLRPAMRIAFTQGEPLYVLDELTFLAVRKILETKL